MKTKRIGTAGWIAVLTLLAGLINTPPVQAANKCTVCKDTAQLALRADLGEARSDYYIASGKAKNISNRNARRKAFRQAGRQLEEDTEEAAAVYGARRDLCKLLKECRYDPVIDPAKFLSPAEAAAAPNPFLPLIPGTVYTYESETEEGTETIVVEVTHVTKMIMGVTCFEVRDTVTLEGEFVEDTLDWYAVHEDGSVWYFGEISFNYEDGEVVDLEGSWKAGENGAKPGIVMLANPKVGEAYRQEWLLGEAEDAGVVQGLGITKVVNGVTYTDCLRTRDINPHEPGVKEFKFYAPGVGFIYEVKPEDGETVELISVVGP